LKNYQWKSPLLTTPWELGQLAIIETHLKDIDKADVSPNGEVDVGLSRLCEMFKKEAMKELANERTTAKWQVILKIVKAE
jgi:hypothetical protein